MAAMMQKCRDVNPSFTGPVPPEDSVRDMLNVIDRITAKDSGAFVSHKGSKEWL